MLTDSNVSPEVVEEQPVDETQPTEVEVQLTEEQPAPKDDCPMCDLREKRRKIINLGIIEGACAMIDDEENRKLCTAMSDAATLESFSNPTNQYAEVIRLGGIPAFNNVMAAINAEARHNFVLAVEKLKADGVAIPLDVEAAYVQTKTEEAMQ